MKSFLGRKRQQVIPSTTSDRSTRSRVRGNLNAAGGGGGLITGNTLDYIRREDAAKGKKLCCCGCKIPVGNSFHKCVKCKGTVYAGICFVDGGGEYGLNGTCAKCAEKQKR